MMALQRIGHRLHQRRMAELQGREVHRHPPAFVALQVPLAHLPAGLVEHPVADGDDQPGAFGQGDEGIGHQQPALRMLPAQQRLGADGFAAGGKLGLVMQDEFTTVQGGAQVVQQLQVVTRIGVHRLFEEAVAVLAIALGVVHGCVGVAQQLLLAGAVARIERDTNTGGDAQLLPGHLERLGQQVDLLAGDAHRVFGFGERHQHHEFIAADARHGVVAAQVATQTQRHILEQQVADMVAERIVDRLEAIEVEEHQREVAAVALDLADHLLDAVFQQDAVGQTGEVVVQGELGQLLVGLGQRRGELCRARLQARIQHRREQRDANDRQGHDDDQHRQPVAAQPVGGCAAEAALGKARRGHAGVVHADDRQAHHQRCATPG